MGKEIITLIKINFDSLENDLGNAITESKLGVFSGTNGLTAHGNVAKFIANMEPEKRYLGWNGEVYPIYKLEKDTLKQ